jgi:hypothetical protein
MITLPRPTRQVVPRPTREVVPRHQATSAVSPEQHDHSEAESAERIAHLPDGARGKRERGRAKRADQQPGQAQLSAYDLICRSPYDLTCRSVSAR